MAVANSRIASDLNQGESPQVSEPRAETDILAFVQVKALIFFYKIAFITPPNPPIS
jgi:hypothetical protein